MIRAASAVAVATVAYLAASGSTQAVPIAPLPAEITSDAGDIIPVYYYRGRYYPYRWRGHYYRYRHYRHGRWHYYY
jgi:hypothetical protein